MRAARLALSLISILAATDCVLEPEARNPAQTPQQRQTRSAVPAEGSIYGTAPALVQTTTLEQLANPAAFEGRAVRTTGVVRAVCEHRGCWFDIGAASAEGARLHVRSLDHSIRVPRDVVGKVADVEGRLEALPGVSSCGSGGPDAPQLGGEALPCGASGGGRRAQLALVGARIR